MNGWMHPSVHLLCYVCKNYAGDRQLNLHKTIKNIKCMYDACRLDRSNVTTVPYLFTCSLFCLYTVGLYISALAHGIDGVLEPYRQALVTIEEQVHVHTYVTVYA